MGRTDDIINVAGHRLSTGGMEEVLAAHPDVAECAVIGIADALKGEVPCGFVVLKAGVNRDRRRDREGDRRAGARARSARSPPSSSRSRCTRLPKTRSGKILRGTMKKIADGEAWTMPATIDDPGGPGRDRRRVEGEGGVTYNFSLRRGLVRRRRISPLEECSCTMPSMAFFHCSSFVSRSRPRRRIADVSSYG